MVVSLLQLASSTFPVLQLKDPTKLLEVQNTYKTSLIGSMAYKWTLLKLQMEDHATGTIGLS